jgi:hypothetical protein
VKAGFEKRLIIVWLLLHHRTRLTANAAITSGAILIALLKVRIIFREFMEVRHTPVLLRRLTDLWVLVAGVTLLGCYFAGMAFSRG